MVTIVENERTVSVANVKAMARTPKTPRTPAWPTPHPNRRKRMIPMMLREHGTNTPFRVASWFFECSAFDMGAAAASAVESGAAARSGWPRAFLLLP